MKHKTYNKLVRDLIPKIIEAAGHRPHSRILNDLEYDTMLRTKVIEEARELLAAKDGAEIKNELADLLELIQTIARNQNIPWSELENTRSQKALERGGFDQKILLEYVEES